MKIYDCFMYSDEEMLLDIRLNSLNEFVDRFVIAEAGYYHNGEPKKLNFNINNFLKFKDKIKYIVVNKQPPKVLKSEIDNQNIKEEEKIINSILRDNYQREQLSLGIDNLSPNDWIIISDLDEIPNLKNISFQNFNNEILIFKQKMYYYKLNLYYQNFMWYGSKAIKKKYFISPQWLRNIKSKKYPFWRLDTYFSKKKYSNIKFVEDGGWHFTCIKKPEDIHRKLLSFAHYQDYENAGISIEQLKSKIKEKKVLYDHSKDKTNKNKWFSEQTLSKVELGTLPAYVRNNDTKFQEWLD